MGRKARGERRVAEGVRREERGERKGTVAPQSGARYALLRPAGRHRDRPPACAGGDCPQASRAGAKENGGWEVGEGGGAVPPCWATVFAQASRPAKDKGGRAERSTFYIQLSTLNCQQRPGEVPLLRRAEPGMPCCALLDDTGIVRRPAPGRLSPVQQGWGKEAGQPSPCLWLTDGPVALRQAKRSPATVSTNSPQAGSRSTGSGSATGSPLAARRGPAYAKARRRG